MGTAGAGSAAVEGRGAAVLALHALLVEGADAEDLHALVVERVAALMDGAAALWLTTEGGVRLAAFGHPEPASQEDMRSVAEEVNGGEHRFVRHVLATGEAARLAPDDVVRFLPLMEPAYRAYLSAHGMSGMLLQPLATDAGPVGVLGVSRDGGRPPFAEDDARFLTQLGHVVTSAFALRRLVDAQRALTATAQEARARADRLAHTDDLTGLPNRRAFHRALRDAVGSGRQVVVLLLDMDDFKAVNDGFGHAVGDSVLVAFADHLRRTAPSGALLARLGGDEFAVCLSGPDGADLVGRAAALVQACRTTADVLGLVVTVHATGGVAETAAGVPADEHVLLQQADVALYRAKHEGVPWARFSTETDAAAVRRLRDVTALRAALADRRLAVHYQRVVPATPSSAPPRLEALVRWERDGELLLPSRFLPLAEQAGLMPALTDCVLEVVLDDLAGWWSGGDQVEVAVNVPAGVLADDFPQRVVRAVEARGLPRRALHLEVTEAELVDAAARASLTRCRALGLDVVVDDFGTGFSALGYLLDMPLSTIKLDRSLVHGVADDPARRALLRHCIELAGELGLQVVAEGVEAQPDADCLVALGVDWLQGFLLHRPGPRELALGDLSPAAR